VAAPYSVHEGLSPEKHLFPVTLLPFEQRSRHVGFVSCARSELRLGHPHHAVALLIGRVPSTRAVAAMFAEAVKTIIREAI
jgi:hypothetical protein